MGWSELSSKRQGLIGVGAAIAFFTSQGHLVSMPLNDSQDYDMIVDDGLKLLKVQVKTTRYKPEGRYSVCLKSSGGTKGETYGTVGTGACDMLFIHAEDGSSYLFPVEHVRNHKCQLSLGPSADKFKIRAS